jgi:hypothetical protein
LTLAMTYRVYTGAPRSETPSPIDRDQWLFKEFSEFDEALGWAQGVCDHGVTPMLLEGDDGTRLTKSQIATALLHRRSEMSGRTRSQG